MVALIYIHSYLRYIILILMLVAIFRHLSGMNSKRPVNSTDKKVDLFMMISAHTTLLIGLTLLIWDIVNAYSGIPFSEIMKNRVARFFVIEHPTGMILAIILITIGRGKVKKALDASAHKKAFWFYLIALILILASVPWPFRDLGRGWLPSSM